MRIFNPALLARQVWYLIDIPDSLCAQVFKAKYYSNGNLVGTIFNENASPCWQAIEYVLELLKKSYLVHWNWFSSSHLERPMDPSAAH